MTSDGTPIPDIATAGDPIRCDDDLRQRWRALVGQWGFGESLLWFVLVDPDRCLTKSLFRVPLPDPPDPFLADILTMRFHELADGLRGYSVACLITRPGSDGVTPFDHAWSRYLWVNARRHEVPLHPIHRANDADLVALTAATNAAA